MKKIYRIVPDPAAPAVDLDSDTVERLNGESLIHLSPGESFSGLVSEIKEWNQFYRIGSNAFALSERAWENCMEMYYVVIENDVELLSVVAGGVDFRVINPRQMMPRSEHAAQICDMTYINSLFRIQDRPSQEVFCFEGLAVKGNEFKFCYEQFGFLGLIFEEIWSGE